jgi:hypothetical protein
MNLPEIAYWLRGLPNPHELADALEQAAKIEELTADWNDQVGQMDAKRRKLEADIASLEKDKAAKFHEVGSIIPETQGQARDILEAAKTKAAEIVKDAEERAAKREEEANEYFRRNIARIEKFKAELS